MCLDCDICFCDRQKPCLKVKVEDGGGSNTRCTAEAHILSDRTSKWQTRVDRRLQTLRWQMYKKDRRSAKNKRRNKKHFEYWQRHLSRVAERKARLNMYIHERAQKRPTRSQTSFAQEVRHQQVSLPADRDIPTEAEEFTDNSWTSDSVDELDGWRAYEYVTPPGQKRKRHPPQAVNRVAYEAHRAGEVGRRFLGFMHLPLEIRNMIYRDALVRGDCFVPNLSKKHAVPSSRCFLASTAVQDHWGAQRARYAGFKVPLSGRYSYNDGNLCVEKQHATSNLLMGVSKALQREAEKIFWAENRFIFPSGQWYRPNMLPGRRISMARPPPPIQDLSVAFSMTDVEIERLSAYSVRCHLTKYAADGDGEDVRRWDSDEWRSRIHEWKQDPLIELWQSRCEAITGMANLKRVQVDLEDCYCEDGCCRLVDVILAALGPWPVGMAPKVIEIMNWVDNGERDFIVHRLGEVGGVADSCIRFLERTNTKLHRALFSGHGLAKPETNAPQTSEEDEE